MSFAVARRECVASPLPRQGSLRGGGATACGRP